MIYTDKMIKDKKTKKEKFNKILKVIVYPFIILIFSLVIYVGYMKYIKHENDVNIFGFRTYMVATGSMEPEYSIGDVIIIKETPKEKIKVGDVINYNQVQGVLVFKISKVGTIITKLLTGTGITILSAFIVLSYLKDKNKEEKIIARENARKLYNVPRYEENDT